MYIAVLRGFCAISSVHGLFLSRRGRATAGSVARKTHDPPNAGVCLVGSLVEALLLRDGVLCVDETVWKRDEVSVLVRASEGIV